MPRCPRCGQPTEADGARCGACGSSPDPGPEAGRGLPRPGAETLVLGSGAHLPESPPPRPMPREPIPPGSGPRESAPAKPQQALRREPRHRDDLARRIVQRQGSEIPPPPPGPPKPRPPIRPSRRGRTVALAGLAAVAVATTIALLSSRTRIAATVTLDAQGRQLLVLHCPDCTNGTLVELQGATARIESGAVNLPVEPELAPGPQSLALNLTEPGRQQEERVVEANVMCRFTPDLAPLSETPPRLALRVEALPTASVVIDGHAVELDDRGHGSLDVDLARDLSGPADDKKSLHRKLPFTATAPGISPARGQLDLSVSVVPLRIEAPGESIVIDTESFMLAGATQSGGSIAVDGRPITVDPTGHFAQRMSVSSVGERTITVRAAAPGLAPRLVGVTIRRVASLAAEAERFAQRAETSYATIAKSAASSPPPSWDVALKGRITELEVRGQRTILHIDVTDHCLAAPCRARVDYGAHTALTQGAAVRVGGRVIGSVRKSGVVVPEIRASILAPRVEP